MSRERELIKNTGILSLGALIPKLIAIIVTPILTLRLTKAEYGTYDLIITVVSLLLPAITLEITSAAFRFLIDKKLDICEVKKIISTMYSFVGIISLVVCSFFLLFVGDRFTDNKFLIFLYFIFDILLITTEQIMRGLGKNFLYSLSYMVRSFTNLILILIFLGIIGNSNFGLVGLLFSMTISTGLALIVVFLVGKVYLYISIKSISFDTLKVMLRYSWPMVPNNLSGWVLRLSDRIVITSVLGIEMNAIYAAANKLPTIFQLFQSTFNLAWQENASLAVKDSDKEKYYSQMLNTVADMLIGVMVFLLALSPFLFKVLIQGDYRDAYYQLPVLYGGMLFLCLASVIGGIYIAYKKTASVGISTMFAAIINLVIDVVFVSKIGIWAGSISTLVSYLALFVYRIINIQHFQKISFHYRKFIYGVIVILHSVFLFFKKTTFCNILNAFFAGGVIFIFDRNILMIFFNIFKRKIAKK